MLRELIEEKGYLLADGATGTNLFSMGLESGHAPELWNLEQPDKVLSNHENFIAAGSDIILTNTFGANRCRLALHKAENEVANLNYEGAAIAKKAAKKCNQNVLVAGSVGPTGELMEPYGQLNVDTAINVFSDQISALKEGGADLIWIETMSATLEMKCAIEAASAIKLPIICTYSLDTHGKTMMGCEPKDLVDLIEESYPQVEGYGANCGIGMSELIGSIICFAGERKNSSRAIVAKSNCGIPEYKDGQIAYTGSPNKMAQYARIARNIGAEIIGGCCGTQPEHIQAMDAALKSQKTNNPERLEEIIGMLGDMSKGNLSMVKQYS
ncbi:MAG: methionine synthase I [Woeseia sp.]|nr:methionine synthase I [Woeseia sp.]|tara:strand:- start:5098 stop:6075 length:978 start_codon:yes stop_codon:yes gene_type:complete